MQKKADRNGKGNDQKPEKSTQAQSQREEETITITTTKEEVQRIFDGIRSEFRDSLRPLKDLYELLFTVGYDEAKHESIILMTAQTLPVIIDLFQDAIDDIDMSAKNLLPEERREEPEEVRA